MHAHLNRVTICIFPLLPRVKVHCSNKLLRHAEGVCNLVSMYCHVVPSGRCKDCMLYMHFVVDDGGDAHLQQGDLIAALPASVL